MWSYISTQDNHPPAVISHRTATAVELNVSIDFRPAAQCVNTTSLQLPSIAVEEAQLVIDYVNLDFEERKRFAQASHEYLFEQLQFLLAPPTSIAFVKNLKRE